MTIDPNSGPDLRHDAADGEQFARRDHEPRGKAGDRRAARRHGVDIIERDFYPSRPTRFRAVSEIANWRSRPRSRAGARQPQGLSTAAGSGETTPGPRAPHLHRHLAAATRHPHLTMDEMPERIHGRSRMPGTFANNVQVVADEATRTEWDYLRRGVESRHQGGGHDDQPSPTHGGLPPPRRIRPT